MVSRYILSQTKEPIDIGSKLTKVTTIEIKSEKQLTNLEKCGAIQKNPDFEEHVIKDAFIAFTMKHTQANSVDILQSLNVLRKVYPLSVFSIVLKEIAKQRDNDYTGRIEKSHIFYAVSVVNGKIFPVTNNGKISFKNFAAFRTIEDAQKAIGSIPNLYKDCFHPNHNPSDSDVKKEEKPQSQSKDE